jgi:hypothetical protein
LRFFLTSSIIADPRIARRYIIFSGWNRTFREKVGLDFCGDKSFDCVLSDGNAHMNTCPHDRFSPEERIWRPRGLPHLGTRGGGNVTLSFSKRSKGTGMTELR